MSKVLVVLETSGDSICAHSLPGITCAQQIARAGSGELHLLVLGSSPQSAADAVGAAGYGAAGVHTLANPALMSFTAEAWADAIVHAATTLGATVVGGTASSSLRDALPRAAALLDAPMCSEITEVRDHDTFVRPISAGRALLEETLTGDVIFFTARGSEFAPAQATDAAPVSRLADCSLDLRGVEVCGISRTESSRPALTEADIIVSGGRGMRDSEGFKPLEALADALGAALGASRAATDAGMVPADLQVGQTGKIVAPNLYIAVAISGAIQHVAGIKGSDTIVAINKDEEAPIFQIADYGLVAKWEDAVPALTAAILARN